MSVGKQSLLVFAAIFVTILVLPNTTAAAACSIQSSCSGTDVAVASVATTAGGHAAPLGEFSNVLCCQQDFQNYYYANQNAFTISTTDNNQGHIADDGVYSYAVTTGYQGCLIASRTENAPFDEVCVAGLANSGGQQGHIAECGTTNYNIICCAWGLSRATPTTCAERDSLIDIRTIHGPAAPDINEDAIYEAEIQWEYESAIQGEIYSTLQGDTTRIQSFTFSDADYSGTKNFSETFNFASAGVYTIHAQAEKTLDASQNDAAQIDITIGTNCKNNARADYSTPYNECSADASTLPDDANWTQRSGYICPPSQQCYTGVCWPGSTYELNTCVETSCLDGDDNDRDGDIDFDDVDCRDENAAARIIEFSASPTQASSPVEVQFVMNAEDEATRQYYNLSFGDGSPLYIADGSWVVSDIKTHTYTQPGLYTATFRIRDDDGNSNSSSLTINVTNAAPTITLSANPQNTRAPNTSVITVGINDDSPNTTVQLVAPPTTTLSTTSMFFDDYSVDQTSTLTFNQPGNHDVLVNATDAYGNWNTQTITVQAQLVDGQDIPGAPIVQDSDCEDLALNNELSQPRCYTDSALQGTVYFNTSDGRRLEAANAEVTLTSDQLENDFVVTANGQGEYSIPNVPGTETSGPGVGYDISAEYQTIESAQEAITDAFVDQNTVTKDITILEDPGYYPNCTNTLGRCDRSGINQPGCFNSSAETPQNYSDKVRVLEACDPSGTAGRYPGDRVILDNNGTHIETALCCAELPTWEPIVTSELEVDAENLIRYTRTATYRGQPVRIVIATWN